MKPPPPRYKIVERDGRLVTIDTWPNVGPAVGPNGGPNGCPNGGAKKGAPAQAAPSGRPGTPSGPDRPPGLPEQVAAALLRVRDEQGRLLLTTRRAWDSKGPRTIALSPAGVRRLGTTALIGGAVLFWAIILAVADSDLLLPIAGIAAIASVSAGKAGVPLFTRLLDSLDERQAR